MFEITIKQVDSQNLLVIDETHIYKRLPVRIESIKMNIISPRIPNGIVENIDVLNYMMYNRTDNEMYRVTSDTLGLNSNVDIPDGVYEFKIKINNTIEEEINVTVVNGIRDQLIELSEKFSFDVDISDDYLFSENPTLINDTSRFLYAMALWNKLLWWVGEDYKPAQVNDAIDKLQRILNILSDA